MSGPRTYVCQQCRGVFEFVDGKDEEAHEEALQIWGCRGDAPGMAIVCDDCFREIMSDVQTSAQRVDG